MGPVLHIIDRGTPCDSLDQLALLAGDGDRVACVGRPPEYAGFNLPAKTVHCPFGLASLGGRRLRQFVRDGDIVHTWSPRSLQAGRMLALGGRCKLLLSLSHLPEPADLPELLRHLSGAALHVTLPTSVARERMLAAGAPSESVHLLPPAARPVADLPRRRQQVRAALGLAEHQRLLVAPAEMVRAAGHTYVVWAHAIVRQIHQHVHLLIPGHGPLMKHVTYFARTTGYNDEIHLTEDRFSRSDVLAAADVAAMFYQKDCGVSALVASMAAGVPVAAGDTPDAAECAPDGEAAVLAEPGSPRAATAAVLKLIDDPVLGGRLGRTAQQIAETRFSILHAKQVLGDIYGQMR
jgi:hypothetical protein